MVEEAQMLAPLTTHHLRWLNQPLLQGRLRRVSKSLSRRGLVVDFGLSLPRRENCQLTRPLSRDIPRVLKKCSSTDPTR